MSKLSRRQTFGFGLGAGLSVTMLSGAPPALAATNAAFSLLLVNDIYKMSAVHGRGGFPKLAAVVKSERARGVPMLFCHAGDTFSPSLMSGFDQGESIVALTNLVAPDVFVPGNHEFDFGKEVFFARMGESKFPYYAANLRQADGSAVPGVRESTIVPLGPVRVGIIGLALAITPKVSQPGNLRFLHELETLSTEAAALRARGADMLVAVAHTDREMDEQIVKSGLVDVLLTGHDHDLAIGYDGKTVMVESNEDGNFVTAIDFTVQVRETDGERKVSWSPSFRVHDTSSIEPDPEVLAVVNGLEAELSKDLDVPVGTTATELDSRNVTVRSREAALGDLVADALRASTQADAAIVNGGGLRGDRLYPAGTVLTRRDILTELPFGNTTVLVAITGADIRSALENGVSHFGHDAGRFPQVSGLTFVFDPKAPVGQRVVEARVGGEPLDAHKVYRVASNDFLLKGGDGYTSLSQGTVLIGGTDGKLVANEVMAYIRRSGGVSSTVEQRITMR